MGDNKCKYLTLIFKKMESDIKKVVIISGVNSFLGKACARKFLCENYKTFGIVRPTSKNVSELYKIENLNIISLDFNNLEETNFEDSIKSSYDDIMNIRKIGSDITFIHFAWGATLDRDNFNVQLENIDMSMNALRFAEIIGAKRFVFAGSQAEMSNSAYGKAKKEFASLAMHELKNGYYDPLDPVKKTKMEFLHLRIFSVYGSEDRPNSLIKQLVKSIKNGIDIELSSCHFKWNFLYIDDFADIIYRLVERDAKTEQYDIASSDTRMLKDYVETAHRVLRGQNKLLFGKRAESKEVFSLPHIKNTLRVIGDFDFTKFEDGIKQI